MPSAIILFCCAIALTLLAWASWTDLVSRAIPNRIPTALVLLFAAILVADAHLAIEGKLSLLGAHAMTAVVVLAIGFMLWSRGILGGGDVKLLSATSLWAGPTAVFPMLMIVAICGGAIGLVQIAFARFSARHALDRLALASDQPGEADTGSLTELKASGISVPYGVAIAIGGAWVIVGQL